TRRPVAGRPDRRIGPLAGLRPGSPDADRPDRPGHSGPPTYPPGRLVAGRPGPLPGCPVDPLDSPGRLAGRAGPPVDPPGCPAYRVVCPPGWTRDRSGWVDRLVEPIGRPAGRPAASGNERPPGRAGGPRPGDGQADWPGNRSSDSSAVRPARRAEGTGVRR